MRKVSREQQRSELSMGAHIRSVKTQLDLAIVDISTTGCRVHGVLDNIRPGELITLRPDGLGEMSAAVIWTNCGEAGLEFDFVMRQEVVDCLSTIYSSAGKSLPATANV